MVPPRALKGPGFPAAAGPGSPASPPRVGPAAGTGSAASGPGPAQRTHRAGESRGTPQCAGRERRGACDRRLGALGGPCRAAASVQINSLLLAASRVGRRWFRALIKYFSSRCLSVQPALGASLAWSQRGLQGWRHCPSFTPSSRERCVGLHRALGGDTGCDLLLCLLTLLV